MIPVSTTERSAFLFRSGGLAVKLEKMPAHKLSYQSGLPFPKTSAKRNSCPSGSLT